MASHDAATDDPLPIPRVEDGRLPGRHTQNRLLKPRDPLAVGFLPSCVARNRCAVVAHLQTPSLLRGEEPVKIPHTHLPHLEILPPPHDDLVGTRAHLRNVERGRRRDAYAAPLAHRKIDDALVPPEHRPLAVHDVAGFRSYLLSDEAAVVAVGDKADVLALGCVRDGQTLLFGDPAHLRLAVVAKRKYGPLQ